MIVRGYFRILSFFDIAEAIELERLRAILGPEAAPLSPAFAHRSIAPFARVAAKSTSVDAAPASAAASRIMNSGIAIAT